MYMKVDRQFKRCPTCVKKGDTEPKPIADFTTYKKPFKESKLATKKVVHKFCASCRPIQDKLRKDRLKHIEDSLLRKSHPAVKLFELARRAGLAKGLALAYRHLKNKKLEAASWEAHKKAFKEANDFLELVKACEITNTCKCVNCGDLPLGSKTYKDDQGQVLCQDCFDKLFIVDSGT